MKLLSIFASPSAFRGDEYVFLRFARPTVHVLAQGLPVPPRGNACAGLGAVRAAHGAGAARLQIFARIGFAGPSGLLW